MGLGQIDEALFQSDILNIYLRLRCIGNVVIILSKDELFYDLLDPELQLLWLSRGMKSLHSSFYLKATVQLSSFHHQTILPLIE